MRRDRGGERAEAVHEAPQAGSTGAMLCCASRAPPVPAPRASRERDRARATADDEALLAIGHDLRTPITAAELAVRAVLMHSGRSAGVPPLPAWAAQRLTVAADGLHRLTGLLEDLIAATRPRVAAGDDGGDVPAVDLRQVVDDVIGQLANVIQRVGCSVAVSCDGDVSGHWPRGTVYQVVANLIANAVKYGAGRPIDVVLARAADRVRLEVSDRGVGIAAAEHAAMFAKFTRARRTSAVEGHGLGLWIVARAARRLGARVAMDSAPDRGTSFVVDLPLVPPRRRTRRPAGARGGSGRVAAGPRGARLR